MLRHRFYMTNALPNITLLSSRFSQLWPFKSFFLSGSRTVVPFYLRIIVYVIKREPPHFSLCVIMYKSRGRIDSQFLCEKEQLFSSKLFAIQNIHKLQVIKFPVEKTQVRTGCGLCCLSLLGSHNKDRRKGVFFRKIKSEEFTREP
jgi:hypothetical protein